MRTLHPISVPQTSKFSRIWVKCTCFGGKSTPKCNEKDNFHKALPNVKKAYVTLRKFIPDLKNFYTDIFAISVTFYNSGLGRIYCNVM